MRLALSSPRNGSTNGEGGIDSVIVEPGPFATGLIDAAPRASDTGQLVEYGELAEAPEQAMNAPGARYQFGWITPGSRDARADPDHRGH